MSVYTAILPGSVKAQVNEQTVYHKDGEGPSVRYWNSNKIVRSSASGIRSLK